MLVIEVLAAFALFGGASGCGMASDVDLYPVVINEIQTSNSLGACDVDGSRYDWLEIRNLSESSVNLDGCSLVCDTASWKFPVVSIAPYGYLLVFAAGPDSPCTQLHANFKLKKKGGCVKLLSPGRNVVSELEFGRIPDECSLCRQPDGCFEECLYPTPGFSNDAVGLEAWAEHMDAGRPDPVKIWEVMPRNGSEMKLPNGKYCDWVELRNTSSQTVSLKGYSLSPKKDVSQGCNLPDISLAPGAFAVFASSGSQGLCPFSCRYLPFKVNGKERLYLFKDGGLVDCVSARPCYYGTSIGRLDGKPGFFYFGQPTPGGNNDPHGCRTVCPAPEFETAPGVYEGADSVRVFVKGEGTVHFTSDGSTPGMQSPVFPSEGLLLNRTAVVKVFCERENCLRSELVCGSYFLSEGHSLPVVSVTMDPKDLMSDTRGIYARGYGASEEFPYKGANFWKNWERPAQIEMFEDGTGFSAPCGIKIFGAYSRGRDKKSFHIKFREKYGLEEIDYPLYGDRSMPTYSSMVLRSGSQDDNGVMLRDEYFTTLMSRSCPTLYVQDSKPVVLYVNGEYFGVYYIREKVNEQYVASHLGVDPDSVTLMFANDNTLFGNGDEYKQLLNYVRTHDMSRPECYEYVTSRIDIMSLIDFKIGEFYSGNQDTGNVKYFKSSDPSCDNKWYWIFYDLDWGFYYDTSLAFYLRPEGKNLFPYINTFISALLTNKEFKETFLHRFAWHMENTFSQENTSAVFDSFHDAIKPEMERNCARWKKGMSYTRWEQHVEEFRKKIEKKPDFMVQQVKEYFHLSDKEYSLY